MRNIPAMTLAFAILFPGCKKNEPEPEPEPAPAPAEQRGDLTVKVTTYDTLGYPYADHSGVKVLLPGGTSATTAANGEVKFTGLLYGAQAPVLLKPGFDGPPMTTDLGAPSHSIGLPFPQHSTYTLSDQQYLLVHKDSINLYFKLDKAIPQGKPCKIAVLTYTASNGGPTAYGSADLISVSSATVSGLNIARLPNLKAAVEAIATGGLFYVAALPVSYGLYQSNLFTQPVLLGESLQYPGNISLIKNW